MYSTKSRKTVIQCDFDGTITDKDVSFFLLDTFASGDWRHLLREYKEGKISVGCFNTTAFAMIRAGRESLLEAIKGQVKIRAGFHELVVYCRRQGLRLVIVSNGLDFYIKAILSDIGIADIHIFAAQTLFFPKGMQVRYVGPDGRHLQNGLKGAYVSLFLRRGYQLVYVGNGSSDFPAAKRCHHIFATGGLLDYCKRMNVHCDAFTDFNDIVRSLEILQRHKEFPL